MKVGDVYYTRSNKYKLKIREIRNGIANVAVFDNETGSYIFDDKWSEEQLHSMRKHETYSKISKNYNI